MNLIKLDAIDSTNAYLKELSSKNSIEDYTVVVANFQTNGRGQMGTNWFSEDAKNLTFSVFKNINCLDNHEQFYLSIATSLAIYKALKQFNIPELKIKWPNDILSSNQKVCGILIENVIKNGKMSAAIIGIGININQNDFNGVINAASLKNITGVVYDKDEVLNAIINQIENYESLIQNRNFKILKEEYEQFLFRKDKPSTFKDNNEVTTMCCTSSARTAGA
jgi:BirA family biotin operon repressor/biotin-[acetyl-CoA-carboxylase] ligase